MFPESQARVMNTGVCGITLKASNVMHGDRVWHYLLNACPRKLRVAVLLRRATFHVVHMTDVLYVL